MKNRVHVASSTAGAAGAKAQGQGNKGCVQGAVHGQVGHSIDHRRWGTEVVPEQRAPNAGTGCMSDFSFGKQGPKVWRGL